MLLWLVFGPVNISSESRYPVTTDLEILTRELALVKAALQTEQEVLWKTGTGKELIARAIHQKSDRRKGRCVAVNCVALPPS